MAEKQGRTESKTKKRKQREITFYCGRCEKQRPISAMRTVTRFIPALLVCQDCAKELQ